MSRCAPLWHARGLAVIAALLLAAAPGPVRAEGEGERAAIRLIGTEDGADWSLPEAVQPAPGTGLLAMDDSSEHPLIQNRGYTLTWAELNPADGVYDWAPVRDKLERAARDGQGVVFRLKANVTERRSPWGGLQAVPGWVLERNDPATVLMVDSGPEEQIRVAVPWDEGVQAPHLKFIEAFGGQGFQKDPHFIGLYVHGISSSFGEEFWADADAVRHLDEAGMTVERLERAFTARLDAWAAAFGDQAGKLAWVGAEWFDAPEGEFERYRDMAARLNRHAIELGMGRRWGHIEHYHGFIDLEAQHVGDDGRQVVDPDHPLLADSKFWGAENENYGDEPDAQAVARHRMALLRALQMGMRVLWIRPSMIEADPVMARYFVLNAGKSAAEAPDAFAVLGEAEVKHRGRRVVLRNLERYLRQVDGEGARTLPAARMTRARFFNDWKDAAEWTARRTDRAAGQSRIRFELDPDFLPDGAEEPLTVKVTWIDDGASWRIEAGGMVSEAVQGSGDGAEKTTTFELPGHAVIETGFGLAAYDGDLAVRAVRLIRQRL